MKPSDTSDGGTPGRRRKRPKPPIPAPQLPALSPVIYIAFGTQGSAANSKKKKKSQEIGSSEPSLSGVLQDMEYQPDISALGLVNFVPLPDRAVPIEQAANRPLSEGQKLHVDHLLSIEDDTMVRNMLIGIRRDGIPPQKYLNDYLSRFAEWGWDETSDERTLELLDTVRQSDWDKWLGQADAQPIESVAQDLANDAKLSLLQSAYNNGWFETPRIAVQLLNDESPAVRAWAKLAILEYEYGIVLSTQRAQGDNTIKGWSYQAIASVFEGVQDTIDAMWTIRDKLDPYAIPQDRASFFRGVVGHLDIRLAVEGPAYYAETFAYDPDGFRDNNYNIIKFFKPGWENRGDWFKFNLVHEIGHVISNRVHGYPMKRVSILNYQFEGDRLFSLQGWGEASGEDWIDEMLELRALATPVVTRQFDHTITTPSYQVNEEWADMFLFWVYDDRAGQITFSHPGSGKAIVGSDQFKTYGEVRRVFMERNLPTIINARYRIRLSPEELVQLAGWGDSSIVLARVNARTDNYNDAEMRKNLEGVVNLEARDINEDPTVVAGKLKPGEATTILGRSRSYPRMVLNISEEGEIGWTLTDLLDLSGVDVESLLSLSDNAIAELQGLEN